MCLSSSWSSPLYPSFFSLISHNMNSMKKRTNKRNNRATKSSPSTPSVGEIQRLFLLSQMNSPVHKMADTCGEQERVHDSPNSPAVSSRSDPCLGIPSAFTTDTESPPHSSSQPCRVDAELRSLLQELPTKADIEALIGKVEAVHRKELKAVKADVQAFSTRLPSGEAKLSTLDHRMTAIEALQNSHNEALVSQQLHAEDLEDRSRRNNLQLRGLPEATGVEVLTDTAIAIFRSIAGAERVELDCIHRALGPKSTDPARTRDVICRPYHYVHKEHIVRQAWEAGDLDFNGVSIKVLPDLSRATLQRRAMLRPLLDLARRKNGTYRWGYPLSVTFRKDQIMA